MYEENKHQEEESKEVSSTQQTEFNGEKQLLKEKVFQPLPSTNVKPAATFKLFAYIGESSKAKIMNWIRVYENMAERSGWSEEEMKWNLSSYLEEEAFDFYVEHVLSKDLDWQQAKQSMLFRFDQFEVEPNTDFVSHKWTPQIELKEYFKKMRAWGVDDGMKEENIIAGLTRGLPVHLRSEFSSATSLKQWAAIAHCLQQRLNGANYKPQIWKPRRNGGNRNRQHDKQRTNQNLSIQTDSHLQSVTNDQNEA